MNDVRIDWYRTKIDKDTLRALTARSDFWGLAQSLGHLGLFAATAGLAYTVCLNKTWWAIIPAFFLHGTVSAFMGVAAACHELSHGTVFKTKWLNEFFYGLFSFLSWSNPVWFRTSHMKHHQYTLHPPADLEVVLPQQVTRKVFLDSLWVTLEGIKFPIRQHWWYVMGRFRSAWDQQIFPESDPQLRRELFNASRLILFGHVALAAAILALPMRHWVLIPILLTPFYCSWLALLCGAPQHLGLQSSVPDFRRSCRTMVLGPITRFLYWRMNYHIEHHMFAAVPFYNLHKLHRLIQADGAPRPLYGLRETWAEIRAIQRKQAEQKDVAFDQFSRGGEPRYVPAHAQPLPQA